MSYNGYKRELMLFLVNYTAENGGAFPSHDTMARHFGITISESRHRIRELLQDRLITYDDDYNYILHPEKLGIEPGLI